MSSKGKKRKAAQEQVDIVRGLGAGELADAMQELLEVVMNQADSEAHVVNYDKGLGAWEESFAKELIYSDCQGDEWEYFADKDSWYCGEDHEERKMMSGLHGGYPNCPPHHYAPYTEVHDA